MIKPIIVIGSKFTSLHTFTLQEQGLSLVLSGGEYWRNGELIFGDIDGVTISIDTPLVDTNYEIWLTQEGIVILSYEVGERLVHFDGGIDMLIWFTLPANATNFTDVDVYFKEVGEEVESN